MSQVAGLTGGLDFDPDELREKYLRERDRRMRSEGEAQYALVEGEFAHYANKDPWAPEVTPREPLTDEVEVVIVGAGFSGMLAAARLREAGVDGVRVIDPAADFGGTWYWNRYPGAQCDFDSYCYLPLLEETGYIPTQKYTYAPEIFEHCQRIAKHYNLYELACFQTRVTELRWDESLKRWIVSTDRDDAMKARFVIVCPGLTDRPKLPNIPGIQDFEGHSFHTSRWDYEYTGGDHTGGMTKLADKKVAVIGTGCTAVQSVPHLAASAEHLYVFQRTPSSVDERRNKPTDPEWVKTLTPGWQRRRRENVTEVMTGQPFEEDLVADGWTEIFRNLKLMATMGLVKDDSGLDPSQIAEIADFQKMNEIRARIDALVEDPQVADTLKPWFRQFCKRPTWNDDYLPTFNRPNVTLIDVADSKGVERITKTGVVAGGVEYPVDCIVYATGFEQGTSPRRRFSYDIIGQNGRSLFEHWAKGVRTLHGHSTRGFPNWFHIGLGQVGVSPNVTAMVDDQAQHIAYIIAEAKKRGASAVQPTEEGEAGWVAEIIKHRSLNEDFFESCTPSYYNSEGKFREAVGGYLNDTYVPGLNAFNALLAEWRDAGDLAGLELT